LSLILVLFISSCFPKRDAVYCSEKESTMDKTISQTSLDMIDDLIPEQKEDIKKAIDEIDSFEKSSVYNR
jgi:hypothetical protein